MAMRSARIVFAAVVLFSMAAASVTHAAPRLFRRACFRNPRLQCCRRVACLRSLPATSKGVNPRIYPSNSALENGEWWLKFRKDVCKCLPFRAGMTVAVRIANDENNEYLRADLLASLAIDQAAIVERSECDATFAKALEAAAKIEDDAVDYGLAVASIAESQNQIGDRRAAEKTLAGAALHALAVVDADSRADEARLIAEAQIAVGLPLAAQKTVREVLLPTPPPHDPPGDRYEEAVLLLSKAGDFASGYAVAKKIREPEARSWAVRTVAYYQASAKGAGETTAAARNVNPLLQSAIYLGAALGLLNRRGIEVRSHYGLLLIQE
jgi:hypothetical protein